MKFYEIFTPIKLEQITNKTDVQKMKATQDLFTLWVDLLRSKFSNKEIRDLAALFWDLVGCKITPIAMTDVESMSFYCERTGGQDIGIILIPNNWLELANQNVHLQLGAMVHHASLAKDFWNFKLPTEDKQLAQQCFDRADYLESVFFRTIQNEVIDFKPNEYQAHILNKSYEDNLSYEGTPFQITVTSRRPMAV